MNFISEPVLWSRLFSEKLQKEGDQLFRKGAAKNAVQTDTGYTVRVRTERNYTVTVDTEFGETANGDQLEYITGMHCGCMQAQRTGQCVHMAAGLYRIAADYGGLYADMSGSGKEGGGNESGKRSVSGKRKEAGNSGKKPAGADSQRRRLPDPADAFPELAAIQEKEAVRRREEMQEESAETFAPSGYRYFHPENFEKSVQISKKIRKEAEKFLKNGYVVRTSLYTGTENRIGSNKVLGQADYRIAEYDLDYSPVHVRLVFDRNCITYAHCDNWTCYSRNHYREDNKENMCEHTTAALLDLVEYLKVNNQYDSTTPAANVFLRRMTAKAGTQIRSTGDLKGDVLDLEPSLSLDRYGAFSCSFRTGAEKLYKVKNLKDFYDHMEKKEPMLFGRKTNLQLGEEYLSETGKAWYAFLKGVLRDEKIRHSLYQDSVTYDPATTKTDSLILYGERLDQFLDLAMGHSIPFKATYDRSKYTLTVRRQDYRPRLVIEPVRDEEEKEPGGIRVTGKLVRIFRGTRSACYVDIGHDSLNCLSLENLEQIEPLLAAREPDNTIDFVIGRNHLADFYHKVLPGLREIADIEETDPQVIEPYLPPEPEITVFLDTETDSIIARAQAVYGREVRYLSDLVNRKKSDPPLETFRDLDREGEVMHCVLRYLPHYDEDLKIFFSQNDEEQIYDFLDHGLQELSGLCEVRVTERFRRLGLKRHVKMDVGVSLQSNLLDLSITSEDVSEEELLDILYQYQQKRRFVRLKNGDFLKLEDNDSLAQVVRMMEDLHLSVKEVTKGKMHLPAYRALYLDKMLEGQADLYVDRDQHFRQLVKEFKTVEDADFEVPQHLKNTIRIYQKEGYRWLRTLDQYGFCGILADEMGLGKTLQVLAVLEAVHEEDPAVSLVVCPASLVYNWIEEAAKFAPSLKAVAVTGTASQRKKIIQKAEEADLLITSYDLLKRDIAEYEDLSFRFEIIDEAQYIKNYRTAAAKSVKLIQAKTKYALTGTPIENRLSELWSIFDYLMPGFLFGYEDFRTNFELPIVKHQDADTMEQLRRMIGPFILRRCKKDVLKDLPDKIEEIQYAGMESKQRKLYDGQVVKMKKELRSQDDSDFRKNKLQILAELMRIRQICCDPDLCFEDYKGGSAKKELCLDLVGSLIDGGHKALLFSQFTSMLEILQKEFDKAGISYYVITGKTPKEKRLEMVKAFNEDDTPVFLISLKAGGTGLNLTGADTVIHYDPWWNTAAEDQATDRAHRIGQKHVVTVYKLVAKDTIEERIIELQKQKAQLAEDILSGENVGSSTFTKEDLMEILS